MNPDRLTYEVIVWANWKSLNILPKPLYDLPCPLAMTLMAIENDINGA